VQKAQEINPDVLLIDTLMPGMSGYEVCEAIRNDPALSTRPVLLLTGSFEPFDEDRARQCGADDHIVKPFESQQIVAKVQQLLELGRQRGGGGLPAAVTNVLPAEATETAFAIPDPFVEAPSPFESTSFDAETETVSPADETVFNFQPESVFEPASEPVAAPQEESTPARSPDDPWGAFTPEPAPAVAADVVFEAPVEPAPLTFTPEPFMPSEEPAFELPSTDNSEQVGASWVPVEEQTFEFREEPSSPDLPQVFEGTMTEGVIPEPEPAFDPAAFETVTAVEPFIEQVADIPRQVVPAPEAADLSAVAAPAALALTEEQLRAAVLSASRETIERIVWEVVPDLAEAMIQEAIKRITEAK